MGTLSANVAVFAALASLGLALLLLFASALAYSRMRSPKLGFTSLAFLALAGEGGYLAWLTWRAEVPQTELLSLSLLTLVALVFLYFAVVKRA